MLGNESDIPDCPNDSQEHVARLDTPLPVHEPVVLFTDVRALGEIDTEVLHVSRAGNEPDALSSPLRGIVASVLQECETLPEATNLPSTWDRPELRVLEGPGKEVGKVRWKAGVAASGL